MTSSNSLPDPAAPPSSGPSRRTAILIFSGLWLLLYFAALFAPPLLDDADATHATAARHMVLSGDLVTLHVNGIRYLEKPPLPYWIVALSFRIFGFNAFATHLPEAIAVLLLTLLGYRWSREAFGPRAAFYTGLAVLTSAGVFLFTRIFIPEVILSLLLCTALYCLLQSLADRTLTNPGAPHLNSEMWAFAPGANRSLAHPPGAPLMQPGAPFMRFHRMGGDSAANLYPYAMWTALALAVLTKGLVALVFFFGTAIVFLALTGEFHKLRTLKPLPGSILFLAIAAPWHILAGLRNTGGMNGHGFFWFYFINEHVLRFLGRRYPMDYNKLPGYLYWSLHLVWLFPWALFLPLPILALIAWWKRPGISLRAKLAGPAFTGYGKTPVSKGPHFSAAISDSGKGPVSEAAGKSAVLKGRHFSAAIRGSEESAALAAEGIFPAPTDSLSTGFTHRTILLLTLYSALILVFFSLSTNQEYYTFPVYLPLLMFLCAGLSHAESTFSNPEGRLSRRWLTVAHATLTVIGLAVAGTLAYGLWTSRHLAFVPDIGDLLAHRGVGDYTLAMSHLFDLTGPSFAALRLPAFLAGFAFAFGPLIAWLLRQQRRHLAATSTVALTSAIFLIAAHIALIRFGPMLSSQDLAEKVQELEDDSAISRNHQLILYGDQAYGSSIPFYLGKEALLVNGRSSSMIFGSTFPDAPHIFLTDSDLLKIWGKGERKILFVPLEKRDDVDRLLGNNKILLEETSGKALFTDRPLNPPQEQPQDHASLRDWPLPFRFSSRRDPLLSLPLPSPSRSPLPFCLSSRRDLLLSLSSPSASPFYLSSRRDLLLSLSSERPAAFTATFFEHRPPTQPQGHSTL